MKRIAIDVPIGYGPREADALARARRRRQLRLLDPRAGALRGAVRRGRRDLRAGARARRPDPPRHRARRRRRRFREVHPEVCFTAMNDMKRLKFRKKSAGGAFERLGLLRKHGINIDPGTLGAAATIPLDDLLDAAACAWTASRRDAVSLPDPPEQRDGHRGRDLVLEASPSRLGPGRRIGHDHERTRGLVGEALADRAEQQALRRTAAARPDARGARRRGPARRAPSRDALRPRPPRR